MVEDIPFRGLDEDEEEEEEHDFVKSAAASIRKEIADSKKISALGFFSSKDRSAADLKGSPSRKDSF